jgi:hypothetical protein
MLYPLWREDEFVSYELAWSLYMYRTYITCYWKFFLLTYIEALCESKLRKADQAYLTYLMLQWQLGHLNNSLTKNSCWFSLYSLSMNRTENTASNNSSVVAWLFFYRGNVFIVPLPINGCLFWVWYSGFHPSCHNSTSFTSISTAIYFWEYDKFGFEFWVN